jgi:hypothetical protein
MVGVRRRSRVVDPGAGRGYDHYFRSRAIGVAFSSGYYLLDVVRVMTYIISNE